MSYRTHATPLALAALLAVGCGGDDRQESFAEESFGTFESTDRPTSAPLTEELRAQMDAFRAEVETTMNSLAADLRDMQEELREDQRDRWQELTERIEENEDAVRTNLVRLDAMDAGEARTARTDAAENLAELEAEVTRAELELAADPELAERAERKLSLLESNLVEIERHIGAAAPMSAPPGDAQPGAVPPETPAVAGDHSGQVERIEELRGEIADVRAEIQQLSLAPVDSDERQDARESIPDTIAELTREVRENWYESRWNGEVPS